MWPFKLRLNGHATQSTLRLVLPRRVPRRGEPPRVSAAQAQAQRLTCSGWQTVEPLNPLSTPSPSGHQAPSQAQAPRLSVGCPPSESVDTPARGVRHGVHKASDNPRQVDSESCSSLS